MQRSTTLVLLVVGSAAVLGTAPPPIEVDSVDTREPVVITLVIDEATPESRFLAHVSGSDQSTLVSVDASTEGGAVLAVWVRPDAPVDESELVEVTPGSPAFLEFDLDRRPREAVLVLRSGSAEPANVELRFEASGEVVGTSDGGFLELSVDPISPGG